MTLFSWEMQIFGEWKKDVRAFIVAWDIVSVIDVNRRKKNYSNEDFFFVIVQCDEQNLASRWECMESYVNNK